MNNFTGQHFKELVELNYQLYNGLFLKLPLDAVEQTGLLLPLFGESCIAGLNEGQDPVAVIDDFFATHKSHFKEKDKIDFLFKIIQYVERQVVLLDAIEDAAYPKIHQTDENNVLLQMMDQVKTGDSTEEARLAGILSNFGIRVTLTAHPTQFYPGQVLAIITDLAKAISSGKIARIKSLLQQLGNTPFFNKNKPTPYDEAMLLSWYLGNIFYPSIGEILDKLASYFPKEIENNHQLISVGFWPGGDRDGNPFVTVETTRKVAARLRSLLLDCYHSNVRELKRRLSFEGVYELLEKTEKQLLDELHNASATPKLDLPTLLQQLDTVEKILLENYQGLYVEKLRSFRRKVHAFGFHFASLDLRQDSRLVNKALDCIKAAQPALFPEQFDSFNEDQQIDCLLTLKGNASFEEIEDPIILDTLKSFLVIADIQTSNGELGCHRYIISNCSGALDLARLYALFQLCGWSEKALTVDLVPLFETVDDLTRAGQSMSLLYKNRNYRAHLATRGERQTVMLGFSDGTKDGGYLMANWSIFQAKENLTSVSRQAGVEVAFFDGRGGPPARGGGSTYKFYAALGKKIESNQIQLTIQGQTVSSHYGSKPAALNNLQQLLAAGLKNNLLNSDEPEVDEQQHLLIQKLANISYQHYLAFKNHPLFLPYLQEMSTLKYYGLTNIGSRPSKRGNEKELIFSDLRAIPFVGAWAQLKQNVPGFYGLGSALKEIEQEGKLAQVQALYQQSKFFRALMDNSMQSMCKSNFKLTAYMAKDKKFGKFWDLIHDEFELSKEMVLKVAGQSMLLENNINSRLSIALREQMVFPLLTVQQYALMRIQQIGDEDDERLKVYEKMVTRSLFGNINASRNSA